MIEVFVRDSNSSEFILLHKIGRNEFVFKEKHHDKWQTPPDTLKNYDEAVRLLGVHDLNLLCVLNEY